ncbi:MAG TPA: hypothetical protein VKU83_01095 [Puia sp.]|nr:hypothetical protein [Puia sp.]
MDSKRIKGKLAEILVFVIAWLIALSLVYLFIVKLALFKNVFH